MSYKYNSKGFTYLELLIVVLLIGIIASYILVKVNPVEKKMIARDNKRFSDISLLERVIDEYRLDHGNYPDLVNTLRDSTILPVSSLTLVNSSSSWIAVDLSKYTSHIPIDPLNVAPYKYVYYHTTTSYELNAFLENLNDFEVNDDGNDPAAYEVGNNLTLISP